MVSRWLNHGVSGRKGVEFMVMDLSGPVLSWRVSWTPRFDFYSCLLRSITMPTFFTSLTAGPLSNLIRTHDVPNSESIN